MREPTEADSRGITRAATGTHPVDEAHRDRNVERASTVSLAPGRILFFAAPGRVVGRVVVEPFVALTV